MLRPYAYSFAGLAQFVKGLEGFKPEQPETLADMFKPSKLDETVRAILPAFSVFCDMLPLPAVKAQVERINKAVEDAHTHEQLIALVADLRLRLQDELKSQMFFHVRPEDVALYEGPSLFGEEVATIFIEAADDIEAAGKCLALRQGTASVFHLMRVLEAGLKRLAKKLKIPYAPSWEAYLRQINAKIAAQHRTKGVAWKRDEPFSATSLETWNS